MCMILTLFLFAQIGTLGHHVEHLRELLCGLDYGSEEYRNADGEFVAAVHSDG
jgi:hypothetical protein